MRRRTFDALLAGTGLLIAVVLVVAGGLLTWGSSFVSSQVHTQLAAQKIYFPPKAAFATAKPGTEITPGMIPYLEKYAGQELTTGPQAAAYADHFIAVHLQEIGGGQTYAQLSTAARALPAGSPAAVAAGAKVDSVFQGTTLRGMLLNAYGFSMLGEIAGFAALMSYLAAALMFMLSGFGLWHARKVTSDRELVVLGSGTPARVEA